MQRPAVSLPHVVREGKTGFVVEPRDAQALAAAIIRALQADTLERLVANVPQAADELS